VAHIGLHHTILPIQTDFENEEGKATCTECDYIKKISVYQSNHVLFLTKIKIMWLMIDAIDNGCLEFRAMIYGGHPGSYWSGLLAEAHIWAIGHFNSLDLSVNFKLTLIKSPHLCDVNHGNNYSQRLHLDSAVAEFLGVYEWSYFCETDFLRYHFQGGFNSMLHFFGEWTEDERVSTKMSSLSMDNVHNYVSSCFTKWSTNIIKHVSTNDNQISLIDITIQHLASFYGHRGGKGSHRGGKGNLGRETAASGGMGINWENKYAEFKRCAEMPKRGTEVCTWKQHK